MTVQGLVKIAIGVALLLAFIPTRYIAGMQGVPMMILVIICLILGIKLIMDGLNQI